MSIPIVTDRKVTVSVSYQEESYASFIHHHGELRALHTLHGDGGCEEGGKMEGGRVRLNLPALWLAVAWPLML